MVSTNSGRKKVAAWYDYFVMASMLQHGVNQDCFTKAYRGNSDSISDGAEDRNGRRLTEILKFTIHSALQQPQDVDRRSQREFHWLLG